MPANAPVTFGFAITPNTETHTHVREFAWRCVITRNGAETNIFTYDNDLQTLANDAVKAVKGLNNL